MPEKKTVATRVVPETGEKLQTVVDARGVSKSEYLRAALQERLEDDHDDLTGEDQIRAEINELERKVEGSSGDESGLPDPLNLFK